MHRLSIVVAVAVWAVSAHAEQAPRAERAWARATVAAVKVGAAYVTLTGQGAPDRLVGASTPVAEAAELHETISDGNVMRMRPVEGLAVPATSSVSLTPGGYHLMLMGLKQPLTIGQHFPLTLRFQGGATLDVDVAVQPAGSAGPKGTP